MRRPVAFDPDFKNRGKGRRRGKVSVDVDAQNLTGSLTFYSPPEPPEGGYIIVSDSNTIKGIGAASAKPVFWTATDATIVDVVSGLPNNTTTISTAADAFSYLSSNGYYVMSPENENIVTDGLVLDLNASSISSYPESGSTWYDLSGNGNNAALISSFDSEFRFNSKYFESRPTVQLNETDHNDGSVWQVPYSSELSPTNEWTVGGLLRISGSQSGNGTGWFHKTGNGDERGIHIEPIGSNFRINGASGWSHLYVNVSAYHHKWTYYTATYKTTGTYGTSTGNLKFYANGKLLGSLTNFTPTADTTSVIRLGRRNGHFQHFLNGDTATYQYYTKELSQSEINQNYYGGSIVTDGLTLALDAGNLVSYESGSTISYSLTGSLSGSLLNGTGYSSDNGGTFVFDGSNDNLQVETGGILGTFQDWSMDAWIKFSTDGYSSWMIIVDQTSYSKYYKNIMVWLDSSGGGNKRIAMYDGSWQYSNSYIPSNTWTHIAATTEGQVAKMYINGQLDATRTYGWNVTTNTSKYLGIGGHGSNSGYRFNGNIALTRIYDKVLSPSEVLQNYNAQRNRFGL